MSTNKSRDLQRLLNEPSLPTLSLPEESKRESIKETGANPFIVVLRQIYGDRNNLKTRILHGSVGAHGRADMLLLIAAMRETVATGYNNFEVEPVTKYLEGLVNKKFITGIVFGRVGSPFLELSLHFNYASSSRTKDNIEKRFRRLLKADCMSWSDTVSARAGIYWD